MSIYSSTSFIKNIGLDLGVITLIGVICLVIIYLLNRMLHNNKRKLVWTSISGVDSRSNLSYDEFVQKYASAGKPVIITDVMKNWKASTKWTLDFFKSEYGDLKIDVRDLKNQTYISMTLADYLDYMTAGDTNRLLYMEPWQIFGHPKLREDYKVPVYFPNWLERLPEKLIGKYFPGYSYIFIGPKNTSIGLHRDDYNTSAWLAIISGQKRCVFLAPNQKDFLYDGQVNVFNPDLDKYPLYAKANPIEILLKAGEIIYFPPGWWHQLENLENSISVSHNAIDEWNSELVFQSIIDASPILAYIFIIMLKFPLISRVVLAMKLI